MGGAAVPTSTVGWFGLLIVVTRTCTGFAYADCVVFIKRDSTGGAVLIELLVVVAAVHTLEHSESGLGQ